MGVQRRRDADDVYAARGFDSTATARRLPQPISLTRSSAPAIPNVAGEYQFATFEIIGCEDYASAAITDTAAVEAGRSKLLEEGIQAPDDRTLVLNFTGPAPYYATVAGIWPLYPAKQELIEAGGEDWWKDPAKQIGNGPFQLTQMAKASWQHSKPTKTTGKAGPSWTASSWCTSRTRLSRSRPTAPGSSMC